MALTPFDYARSITETKEYLYEDVDRKNYTSFIVNKSLSFNEDLIFLVNEINQFDVDPKQHYDFLFHVVPKRKRYGRWVKTNKYDDVEFLSEVYQINHEKAKEILDVLSESELEQIKENNNKGGIE